MRNFPVESQDLAVLILNKSKSIQITGNATINSGKPSCSVHHQLSRASWLPTSPASRTNLRQHVMCSLLSISMTLKITGISFQSYYCVQPNLKYYWYLNLIDIQFSPVSWLGLLLWWNLMTKNELGKKGFIWLILPHYCSSSKDVRTETRTGQEAGWRSWCRGHGGMFLTG